MVKRMKSVHRKWQGILAGFLVLALVACLLPTSAIGTLVSGKKATISSYEAVNPVYTTSVDLGTDEVDMGLPSTLRAIVPLDELDLDADTFTQSEPVADTSDGYESYDYYWYGYVAPVGVDDLYAEDELVVYSIYGQDYIAYRVYGTIRTTEDSLYRDDEGSCFWFACEEDGTLDGIILNVEVSWSGSYDSTATGVYTLEAKASDYKYNGEAPTAEITVYDSNAEDEDETEDTEAVEDTEEADGADDAADADEEEVTTYCTCDYGVEGFSDKHDPTCPWYRSDETEEIHCTCEVGEDTYSSEHDEDCPYYVAEVYQLEGCTCGVDGVALYSDDEPWQHAPDCIYYSPQECVCREEITVMVEDEGESGGISYEPYTTLGDYTHEHDSSNVLCSLYGSDTVGFIKLATGETSYMRIEDATEIEEAQEEGTILYPALGEIEVLWDMAEYAVATADDSISTDTKNSLTSTFQTQVQTWLKNNIVTDGSDAADNTWNDEKTDLIPNTWVQYVNTIYWNRGISNFAWTTDFSNTTVKQTNGTYWKWSGATATKTSGDPDSDPLVQPTYTTVNGWRHYTVYSGEQLAWALYTHQAAWIELGCDIDMNGAEYNWATVNGTAVNGADNSIGFNLVGNGHTIYNLSVYGADAYFLQISYNSTVKDINFESCQIVNTGTSRTGMFYRGTYAQSTAYTCVYTDITIANSMFCSNYGSDTIKNGSDTSCTSVFGSLCNGQSSIGRKQKVTMTNCASENNYIYGVNHVSGFANRVGNNYQAMYGADTSYYGDVSYCYSVNNLLCGTGGHSAGFISCDGGNGLNISNCFSDNEIYGSCYVAAFRGGTYGDTTNCFVTGKLEGYKKLAGFTWSWNYQSANSNIEKRTFTNCYTTTLVGMRTGSEHQAGFAVHMHVTDSDNTAYSSNNGRSDIYINCYAAGEVGNYDLDLDSSNSINQRTMNSNAESATGNAYCGGFVDDYSDFDSTSSWSNCYYDKQTTAMREWVSGNLQVGWDGTNSSLSAVKGVLTTDSDKSGTGLTSEPGAGATTDGDGNTVDYGFTGFKTSGLATGASSWVYTTDHYPQLSVFSSASTSDWGDAATAQKVKDFSLASVSTVFLDNWENGYDWNDVGVRSSKSTDAYNRDVSATTDHRGSWQTYDTVREIIRDFTVTGKNDADIDVEFGYMVEGGAITSTRSKAELEALDTGETINKEDDLVADSTFARGVHNDFAGGDIAIDNDTYDGSANFPGMEWFWVHTNGNENVYRPLRLITYMTIDAGDDKMLANGSYYSQGDDVSLLMVDHLLDNMVLGQDDDEIWSYTMLGVYPTRLEDGYDNASTLQNYYNLTTTNMNTGFPNTANAWLYTEIWEATTVEDDAIPGSLTYYYSGYGDRIADEMDENNQPVYKGEEGNKLYAKASVHVSGTEASEKITYAEKQWLGLAPFVNNNSSEDERYIVAYYWVLADGRYVTDYKVITLSCTHNVEVVVRNYENGDETDSLNSEALTLHTGIVLPNDYAYDDELNEDADLCKVLNFEAAYPNLHDDVKDYLTYLIEEEVAGEDDDTDTGPGDSTDTDSDNESEDTDTGPSEEEIQDYIQSLIYNSEAVTGSSLATLGIPSGINAQIGWDRTTTDESPGENGLTYHIKKIELDIIPDTSTSSMVTTGLRTASTTSGNYANADGTQYEYQYAETVGITEIDLLTDGSSDDLTLSVKMDFYTSQDVSDTDLPPDEGGEGSEGEDPSAEDPGESGPSVDSEDFMEPAYEAIFTADLGVKYQIVADDDNDSYTLTFAEDYSADADHEDLMWYDEDGNYVDPEDADNATLMQWLDLDNIQDLVRSVRVTIWVAEGEGTIEKVVGEGLDVDEDGAVTDENSVKLLAGAQFALYSADDEYVTEDEDHPGQLIIEEGAVNLINNSDYALADGGYQVSYDSTTGILTMKDLLGGDYYLVETDAPANYTRLNGYWLVHVDYLTERYEITDSSSNTVYSGTRYSYTNASGNVVELYLSGDSFYTGTYTYDEKGNGTLVLSEHPAFEMCIYLQDGIYYYYDGSNNKVRLYMGAGGYYTADAYDDYGNLLEGAEATFASDTVVVSVEDVYYLPNYGIYTLPSTGNASIWLKLSILIGYLLLALGAVVIFVRKEIISPKSYR